MFSIPLRSPPRSALFQNMPKALKLTPLMQRFVDEYLIDLNGTRAMLRAGYSGKRPENAACKLLAKAQVRKALDAARARRQKRTEVTQDYVIAKIQDAVERCEYTRDNDGVFKGAQLLGLHLGMFKQKLEHSGPGGKPLTPPVINIGFGNGGPGGPSTSAEGT